MAKYRTVFIEEATEHLAEMSVALLELEKDSNGGDAIDLIFRMAHSIKGMAASLEYDSITQVSHVLEDRMQAIRSEGRVRSAAELGLLFRGLECLEAMVRAIRETGESPPPVPELVSDLAAPLEAADSAAGTVPEEAAKKKKPNDRTASPVARRAPDRDGG